MKKHWQKEGTKPPMTREKKWYNGTIQNCRMKPTGRSRWPKAPAAAFFDAKIRGGKTECRLESKIKRKKSEGFWDGLPGQRYPRLCSRSDLCRLKPSGSVSAIRYNIIRKLKKFGQKYRHVQKTLVE